jgi:nucleoside-diphosphate-sugar epimerase
LRHGVKRLVYCSTQGVHGDIKSPPGDETSPIAPEDYYQETKYLGEKVVEQFVRERGLNAVTLRPTAIYGPGDPGRWLHLFRLTRTGRFTMFGSGRTTYHPVYIDNLVDAFILAQDRREVIGEAFIIADAEYYTLNDLVRHVGRAMGVEVRVRHLPFWPLYAAAVVCEGVCGPLRIAPPLFRRRVDWFRQVRAFRIDKARRMLGYVPRVGIEEGLRTTGEWYTRHGYL